MLDLKQTTIIIPIKIEHQDRYRNAKTVLNFMNTHFETNVFIYESSDDGISRLDFLDELTNLKIKTWIIKDEDSFHRTKYLNIMLDEVETDAVANYDIDILLEPTNLYNCQNLLIYNKADVIFPYGYGNNQIQILETFNYPGFAESGYNLDYIKKSDKKLNHTSECGHCVMFRTSVYREGFGENENFISYGPEDKERMDRFKKMKYNVRWMPGETVYHLEHYRGNDSWQTNPYYRSNWEIFERLKGLSYGELMDYYINQIYQKKYNTIGTQKKILITGGNGLIGRAFSGDVRKIGSKNCDLRNPSEVKAFIEKGEYTGIIHCAAKVGGIQGNLDRPGEFFYDNIMMNTNVIEEARKAGIKKLIFFASTCVFPDSVEYPLSPEKIHNGNPHPSNYAYAFAKRMGDVQIQAYKDQYDLDYFTVIPGNVYGPGDMYNLNDAHVIPALIHKMYLAKLNGTEFKVWGSGTPLREFIFSEDVAKLTMLLYDNYTGRDPVILSTSEEISIREVVLLIAELMEYKGSIIFDSSKPDGQYRKPSDNSVITNMFPDFKFTPIREGLSKSINWFIENYPNVRL
jgi:GDP-L-fucose synthase